MKSFKTITTSLFLGAVFLTSCSQQSTEKKEKPMENKVSAIDAKDMDLNVKPGVNFFEYANGGWMKTNPVPSDKSQYGSFTVLYDNNQEQLKSLINELTQQENEANTNAQKIADFYKSGMDTAKREALSIKPLLADLEKVKAVSNIDDFIKTIGEFHSEGISGLFYFSDVQDEKNSKNVISILYQGGIGMPDRDYYVSEEKRMQDIKAEYEKYVAKMFQLAQFNNAEDKAKTVLDIETKLAENSFTRLELRDPFKNYNKMNLEELNKIANNIPWNLYFQTIGLDYTDEINVAQIPFIEKLSALIKSTSIEDLKTYLQWKLINSEASSLTDEFGKTQFDFYGTVLSGQKEQRPRWKRILSTTDGALGEALGELYVKKYFPPSSKERMIKLVDNLRKSFAHRITKLAWMTDSTKEKALEKLDAITVKIGYPDKWEDYSSLEITADNFYQNIKNVKKFNFKKSLERIGKPHDKTRWGMTPQTVNAYYSPNSNEIVFPAAILQPPFFYENADDAVNYGAIGVVIGHEMTHGFDDQGRNYDKEGNLNNWWTETDAKAFEKTLTNIKANYSNYVELDSLHVDGELTLGENIADLGGLNISWDAFMTTEQAQKNDTIDGFTAKQRFYLSYSKVWRQNILPEELMKRLKEDVHSPGDARVNVALFNVDEFYNHFNIEETDPLFVSKEKRAIIW